MYAVYPECGGKAGTHPDAVDYYASIIISEFMSQCPMHLTYRTQIKSVTDGGIHPKRDLEKKEERRLQYVMRKKQPSHCGL